MSNIGWDLVEEYNEEEDIFNIDNDTIEFMIEKLDLYDYFSEKEGLQLSSAGGSRYSAKCPFKDHNEQEPSFIIYEDTNSFYCFGCKRGGSIFQWLTDSMGRNMHFIDAVKYVASLTGVSVYSDPITALERIEEKIIEQLEDNEEGYMTAQELNYIVSRLGYQHVKNHNFDSKEIEFINKIYLKLDGILLSYNQHKKNSYQLKANFIKKIQERGEKLLNEN